MVAMTTVCSREQAEKISPLAQVCRRVKDETLMKDSIFEILTTQMG